MEKCTQKIIVSILIIATALLTGCSSNHTITTTDGQTIITKGKPEVDDDTGLVSFKDAQTGVTQQINRDQIKNMSELDF